MRRVFKSIPIDVNFLFFHVLPADLVLPAPDLLLSTNAGKSTITNFYFINALFLHDLKYNGTFNAAAARRLGHLLACVVYRVAPCTY